MGICATEEPNIAKCNGRGAGKPIASTTETERCRQRIGFSYEPLAFRRNKRVVLRTEAPVRTELVSR